MLMKPKDKRPEIDDSPVSHNTRLGVAKKREFNQFLSELNPAEALPAMAEGWESVTSCGQEKSSQKDVSEDLETSGLRSLRSTTSLVFNLENYLLEDSPQQNVGNVPEELHRKGADTPQSRSSSVVKRDILRTQGDRGIARGLFRTEDESGQAGERGELGERLRVRHLPGQEGIIDANVAEKATLGLRKTVAKISSDQDRCRIAAMSEVAESSQGAREKPEGSLSGEHGNFNMGTGRDIDSHRRKAPPKSPRPAGVLS
ncbi:hypothetical protein R1sor_014612 [Riccia sorocarpa]|uniref:Uncharacterized protein n=1 Tax=Riccia sorocarpa TaxID=122646 RepID=A0ABD3HA50_9MARC